MNNRLKKQIEKYGAKAEVYTKKGRLDGIAVIYPIRSDSKITGGNQALYEGISEADRYSMYSSRELMKYSSRGDTVKCAGDSYIILWKDDFSFNGASYTKTCLKKINSKDGDGA